ncbi:MAG TPA: BTAD domain-containing putative transcriptional regulator [Gaiellaceae bacterium]
MEFRILGPLEVRDGDRTIPLAGGRQGALLALLILNANETLSTDRLVDELWAEKAPATAPKVVQNYVSQLRRALGDGLLVTQGGGYALRLEPGSVDIDRFERLLAEGRKALADGDAEPAAERLREALALWRGPPLADFMFEPFAQTEIAQLEERRLVALEERIEADLALGRHVDLVGELEALIAEHPLRERLRGQLMLCLYRSGRQAEALEVYQATRRALVEGLGIEPGPRLRELHQAILKQDPGLDFAATPELAVDEGRGAFVGREPELAELISGLDDAFAGRGRLFLLVGEPGIGKSRLAEELIGHARARGARILVGRCWEAGGAPAYWPWVQSFRAYMRDADPSSLREQLGAGAADVAQILPELRETFDDLPDLPAVESEGARFSLFDATAEFIRRASETQPILLFVDDLHAADVPSLLLLQFLARELGSMRMLVVAAYRDVDPIPGGPLTEAIGDLVRQPGAKSLRLTGLAEPEVAEYVDLTASDLASPELIVALHQETEGNPLFLVETVQLMAIEGVGREPGRPEIAIPQSVHAVIARRLAHLSDECNRLLILAAVLGRDFSLDALARIGDVSQEQLLDVLDEAMTARVLSEVRGGAPGRLRFAHVLIRDTLYEGLTTVRRIRLHRSAIEALEALYGDEPGPHLAELAHHAIAGSEFGKAVDYARRAGDRALEHLAYEEAARLYETALDALAFAEPGDETIRCELLLSSGEATARAGDTPAAREAFLEAAAIARRTGLPRQLARAAAGYGGGHMWGRAGSDAMLVPLLEEGLDALGDRDDVLRARLLARLAGAIRDEHSRERRDALSKEALDVARRTGSPAALVWALDGRSAAIIGPDTIDECLVLAHEFRQVSERSGDLERLAYALDHRRTVLVMVGDLRSVETDLAREVEIVEQLKQPGQLWQVHAAEAMLALAVGELAEAERLIPQAFQFGERSLRDTALPVYELQQWALADLQGRSAEVAPALRDLAAAFPARVAFQCALALLDARLGREDEARQALAELRADGFSGLPFDQEWLWAMSLLAETAVLLGDREGASAVYDSLAPWAALTAADHPEGMRGSVARYLGLLSSTMQRWPDAEKHFEDALTANEHMGVRTYLAHTQYDYACMLLERAGPGDADRAEALLASAKALSDEIGLLALAERISKYR